MQPIISALKLPQKAYTVLKELFDLLSKPNAQLPIQFRNNPDALLDYLRDLVAPLQNALSDIAPTPEKNIRLDVYKSFAKLIEKETRIHQNDIYTWLLFKKESDHPLDHTERERAHDTDRKLSPYKIVLQCKYINDGPKKYRRVDSAYITRDNQQVRSIESDYSIFYDDILQQAQEALVLRNEPEFTFIIL